MVSRFSTVSNVWLLSKIFRYAASVSLIVLSYSLREATWRKKRQEWRERNAEEHAAASTVTRLARDGVVQVAQTLGEHRQVVLDLGRRGRVSATPQTERRVLS